MYLPAHDASGNDVDGCRASVIFLHFLFRNLTSVQFLASALKVKLIYTEKYATKYKTATRENTAIRPSSEIFFSFARGYRRVCTELTDFQ